jgi:hypothetical protein
MHENTLARGNEVEQECSRPSRNDPNVAAPGVGSARIRKNTTVRPPGSAPKSLHKNCPHRARILWPGCRQATSFCRARGHVNERRTGNPITPSQCRSLVGDVDSIVHCTRNEGRANRVGAPGTKKVQTRALCHATQMNGVTIRIQDWQLDPREIASVSAGPDNRRYALVIEIESSDSFGVAPRLRANVFRLRRQWRMIPIGIGIHLTPELRVPGIALS